MHVYINYPEISFEMGKGIRNIQFCRQIKMSWLLFWNYDPCGPENTIVKTGI